MDRIKLLDNTMLDIEDGASLANIVHNAKTTTKAREAAAAFTDANLRHVEFLHDGLVNGIYDNLGLIVFAAEPAEDGAEPVEARQNPLIEGKKVTIALYQK